MIKATKLVKVIIVPNDNDPVNREVLQERGFHGVLGNPVMQHKTGIYISKDDIVVFNESKGINEVIHGNDLSDRLDEFILGDADIKSSDNVIKELKSEIESLKLDKIPVNDKIDINILIRTHIEESEDKEEAIKTIRTLLNNIKSSL